MEENPKKSSGKATASLILGIISLVAWLLPLIGYPVSIVGLCLGISDRKKEKDHADKDLKYTFAHMTLFVYRNTSLMNEN